MYIKFPKKLIHTYIKIQGHETHLEQESERGYDAVISHEFLLPDNDRC